MDSDYNLLLKDVRDIIVLLRMLVRFNSIARLRLLLVMAIFAWPICAQNQTSANAPPPAAKKAAPDPPSAGSPWNGKVELKDAMGKPVGTAIFTANKNGGVLIHMKLQGLLAGEHAAHIHEVAKCEDAAFISAGGHFNPDMKQHGLENENGPHAGDLANFIVGAKGKVDVTFLNSRVTSDNGPHSLFTNGGTALVIHAQKDDMHTDPAGNAGPRIACGTITK